MSSMSDISGDNGGAGPAPGAVFTDSHAHLEMVAERLGCDALADILARYAGQSKLAGSAPLSRILDIGVDPGDLARRKLAVASAASADAISVPTIRWAAGIWPGKEALAAPSLAFEALERDLGSSVDALGECGLDYHHMDAPERKQIALFAAQAQRAHALGLPLIVHSREAFADTLGVVAPLAENIPVIIHCFGYGPSEADAFLRAGCYISFAGNLTYAKSEALRAALRLVPQERLLLETDAPYMNPTPRRGVPSSPLDIGRTYELAASLLQMEISKLRDLISTNLENILGATRASR